MEGSKENFYSDEQDKMLIVDGLSKPEWKLAIVDEGCNASTHNVVT